MTAHFNSITLTYTYMTAHFNSITLTYTYMTAHFNSITLTYTYMTAHFHCMSICPFSFGHYFELRLIGYPFSIVKLFLDMCLREIITEMELECDAGQTMKTYFFQKQNNIFPDNNKSLKMTKG